MATLLKVLNNLADIKSAGGVALRVRTQDRLVAGRGLKAPHDHIDAERIELDADRPRGSMNNRAEDSHQPWKRTQDVALQEPRQSRRDSSNGSATMRHARERALQPQEPKGSHSPPRRPS